MVIELLYIMHAIDYSFSIVVTSHGLQLINNASNLLWICTSWHPSCIMLLCFPMHLECHRYYQKISSHCYKPKIRNMKETSPLRGFPFTKSLFSLYKWQLIPFPLILPPFISNKPFQLTTHNILTLLVLVKIQSITTPCLFKQ